MDPLSLLGALKVAVDLIKGAYSTLINAREKDKKFWLEEILEPIQKGMSEVNEIYLKTFNDVIDGLSEKRRTLQETMQFLTDRHYETVNVRDNLQGLRIAAEPLSEVPEDIRQYLKACEEYFGDATSTAVGTPLRALLEKLRSVDHALTVPQIENLAPLPLGNIAGETINGLENTLFHLERSWPEVLENYHRARLHILRSMH